MIHLEFHCHTLYSGDSLTSLESLLAACERKGIDRLVITDHNTIAGAVEAHRLDPQRVIVGEEVMTRDGELLAAFVQEEVPPYLPPVEAIARLRDQRAFISVSHPFDRFRRGAWSREGLLEIAPLVDAIETFNARCMAPEDNTQAQAFAREHGLPGTAGSDAHVTAELGKALMLLPDFHDADSLRRSMKEVEIQAALSPPWIHITSRYAKWRKRFGHFRGKNI
jgi:predicted metal-dependent phosphoesterase TrpH